jgi:hypothetical protein
VLLGYWGGGGVLQVDASAQWLTGTIFLLIDAAGLCYLCATVLHEVPDSPTTLCSTAPAAVLSLLSVS